MNILFLYSSIIDPSKGGVQRVSHVLGNYFMSNGHKVYYLSLEKKTTNNFNDSNQYNLPNSHSFLIKENIVFFESFLVDNQIDLVINQGGNDIKSTKMAVHAKNVNVKFFSVIHNSILSSINNFRYSKSKFFTLCFFKFKFFDLLILKLYWFKYKQHYELLYEKSDKILLLSDSYKKELQFFLKEQISNKVIGIPNPCSFTTFNSIHLKKEKVLIFVGRVDFSQKKIDILLQIWNKIHMNFIDWTLEIVGDGPDLELAKKMCRDMHIDRVYFEGFQDPRKYYEKASIFCMTSSFEGFPMVLLEAMFYGVVPIAFKSFESISDIITHNYNGLVIEPFDINEYVFQLSKLMKDDKTILQMSENSKNISYKYSLDKIGSRWIQLINNL